MCRAAGVESTIMRKESRKEKEKDNFFFPPRKRENPIANLMIVYLG